MEKERKGVKEREREWEAISDLIFKKFGQILLLAKELKLFPYESYIVLHTVQ